jgi:hypothetical protein
MGYEFPSGPWRGYWLYPHRPARHKMRLDLKFAAGRVMGDGDDEVGYFVINGRYDAETGDVHWTKTYPRRHQVFYSGRRDTRGISGMWEIHSWYSGGFAIWPGESEEGPAEIEHVEEQLPVEHPIPIPSAPQGG